MKRILLFLGTNIAVLVVLSVVMQLLGIESMLNEQGTQLDLQALLMSLLLVFVGTVLHTQITYGLVFTAFAVAMVWALVAQPWLGDGRKAAKKPAAARVTPPKERKLTPQELINERVRRASEAMAAGDGGGMVVAEDPVEFDGDLRVFTWEDGEALRNWVGTTVILEGTLLRVRDSRSGKTRYLEFQESTSANDVCGYFKQDNRFGRDLKALKALEGKKIRCKGKVAIEQATGRVVVDMVAPPMLDQGD